MTSLLLQRLPEWADTTGAWLASVSVQLGALALVIVAADRLMAGRALPHVRAAMWWLLILAPAASLLLESPVSVWRVVNPAMHVNEWVLRINGAPLDADDPWRLLVPTPTVPPAVQRAGRVAVGAWLSGCVVLLGLLAWRALGVQRGPALRFRTTAPDWLVVMVHRAARRMKLQTLPDVRVCEGKFGPAVVGVLRPRVVLPATLVDAGDRDLIEHVLLHEFAHVRRRDPLMGRICQIAQVAFWFHPAMWLARRQLDLLREIGCDGLAAQALCDEAPAYRLTLLRLARSLLVHPAATGFVHTHSQIMARLTHLDLPPLRRPRRARAAATCVFGMLLMCCVPRIAPTSQPAEATAEELNKLPACLQLRYAVMRAMANERAK